jgi:hypothetical protein
MRNRWAHDHTRLSGSAHPGAAARAGTRRTRFGTHRPAAGANCPAAVHVARHQAAIRRSGAHRAWKSGAELQRAAAEVGVAVDLPLGCAGEGAVARVAG